MSFNDNVIKMDGTNQKGKEPTGIERIIEFVLILLSLGVCIFFFIKILFL